MSNLVSRSSTKILTLCLERFMEWIKSPMKSSFSTLVGKIDDDLKAGHYLMRITNGKNI